MIEGRYGPGDRLRELHLAEEFGTSQGPVREALRSLAARGVVEIRPHRGATVRSLTIEEMHESLQVRACLEQYAAELCAQSPNFDHAELSRIVEHAIHVAQSADNAAYVRADLMFHRAIVHGAGNGILAAVWSDIDQVSRIRYVSTRVEIPMGSMLPLAKQHAAVAEQIRLGNPERAGELLRQHVEFAAQTLNTLMSASSERPPS